MPNCDVCLVECRDGGVLACKHVVCRTCGMSQSKCLVCANVVGQQRRLGKRVIISRNKGAVRVEDVPNKDQLSDDSTDSQVQNTSVSKLATPIPIISPKQTPSFKVRRVPLMPTPPSPEEQISPVNDLSPPPQPPISVTPPETSDPSEPQSKRRKKETFSTQVEGNSNLNTVHGPTAFDEVRCELRALGSTPRLQRSALRTTGKLSIALLSKFLHQTLQLTPADDIILRCSGEDLIGSMTLGHLATHVWPETEGHMILDYRLAHG